MLQALFNVERIHGGNVLNDVKQSLKVNRRSVEGDTRECSAITVAINDSKKISILRYIISESQNEIFHDDVQIEFDESLKNQTLSGGDVNCFG